MVNHHSLPLKEVPGAMPPEWEGEDKMIRELFRIVNDPRYNDVVRWGDEKKTYIEFPCEEQKFQTEVPKTLTRGSLLSFRKLLNTGGFTTLSGFRNHCLKHPQFNCGMPHSSHTSPHSSHNSHEEQEVPAETYKEDNSQLKPILESIADRMQKILDDVSVIRKFIVKDQTESPRSSGLVHDTNVNTNPNKILFPYDRFVELFKSDLEDYPPCGLLNSLNSCFLNAILQCLCATRPLVVYCLQEGHCRQCKHKGKGSCTLCQFELHLKKMRDSSVPFCPAFSLSGLPGNLDQGDQEDAQELWRLMIENMHLSCLDEFGRETVSQTSQETTIIQYLFAGKLMSKVVCLDCDKISEEYEQIMDVSIEIHGEPSSLEKCLVEFTRTKLLR